MGARRNLCFIGGNLTSVFRLVRAFVPVLPAGSAIVQVNGLSADVPYPTNGAVGATSAGTKSLMRTTAVELDGAGLPRYFGLSALNGSAALHVVPDWISK